MTEWFEDDDPHYLDWLAGHPEGFVLDTYVRPRADHLILHRASCPRVSRPLPGIHDAPRFGKACADRPAELRTWAAENVGAEPRDCGVCRGDSM